MVAKSNGHGNRRSSNASRAATASNTSESPSARTRVPTFIREGASTAREVGGALAERVGEEAMKVTRSLQSQGERFIAEQKGAAAQEVGRVGAAIRQAADRLHKDQIEGLAQYAESAAEGIDQVSRYLTERDLGALTADVEELAHRQPAWFLGGMMLAGFALGRFIKAGKPRRQSSSGSRSQRRRSRSQNN